MTKLEYYQYQHDIRTNNRRASIRASQPIVINVPRHCQECGKELQPVKPGCAITTKNLICDKCVIDACKNMIEKRRRSS
jgi:hypothetical protein